MKDSGSYSQEEEFISGSDYSGEDYSEGDEEDYSEEDENTHTETENYESQQDDVTKQSDIPESEVSKNKAGDIRESFKDGDMDKSGMSPSRVELKPEEGKIPPKVSASQGKLDNGMKNKEAILSKAVIATLGYEMLQREFIEVLVIYLMNKHNLRSHNKDQLEAELDRNFNLMNAVGSKRNRNESKPECRTW